MSKAKQNTVPASSSALALSAGGLVPDASLEPKQRAAADRVEADLLSVSDEETLSVTLDVATLVGTVVWVDARLAEHFELLAAMPRLDVARLRKLSDYAYALSYWQQRARLSASPVPGLADMVQAGVAIRERTLHDLGAHVRHGHIASKVIEPFTGTLAYRRVGEDLEALSIVVHEHWRTLEGRTLITLASMDAAYQLGARIIDACAARRLAPMNVAHAAKMRDKAYTRLLRTYGEARDAMTYLRRTERDVDTIVPSLYASRRRGKRGGERRAPPAQPL